MKARFSNPNCVSSSTFAVSSFVLELRRFRSRESLFRLIFLSGQAITFVRGLRGGRTCVLFRDGWGIINALIYQEWPRFESSRILFWTREMLTKDGTCLWNLPIEVTSLNESKSGTIFFQGKSSYIDKKYLQYFYLFQNFTYVLRENKNGMKFPDLLLWKRVLLILKKQTHLKKWPNPY